MRFAESNPSDELEIIKATSAQLEKEAREHYYNPLKAPTELERDFGIYGIPPQARAIGWKALLQEIDAQRVNEELAHPDAYSSPEY